MLPRILIAGIGNIFRGDDEFGCEVVHRLSHRKWPDGVCVRDYGIRGMDLAFVLTEGIETTILVDATPQGSTPGTVYTMELSLEDAGESNLLIDAHSMHPLNVLRMVRTLGGNPGRILLVGCEPEDLGDELEGKMGLSEPVRTAIDIACHRIEELVEELSRDTDDISTMSSGDTSFTQEAVTPSGGELQS